jgi:hypothetical protein
VKIVVRLALIACACTTAHAFAAGPDAVEPSQASPPASAEAPAAPPASSTTSTAAPAAKRPTKVILIDNTPNDEQLKQILARGYRPEGKGDKVLYCRKEAQVGTRFETKTCRTSQRILEDEAMGKAATERAQRVGGAIKAN